MIWAVVVAAIDLIGLVIPGPLCPVSEGYKVMPFGADKYSSCAVVGIPIVGGVMASLDHISPNAIESRPCADPVVAVLGARSSGGSGKTSARCGIREEFEGSDGSLGPAIASARVPQDIIRPGAFTTLLADRLSDYRPRTEAIADSDAVGFHACMIKCKAVFGNRKAI